MAKDKKQPRPKAETPKGFRDYFGQDVTERRDMLDRIAQVYHRHGFDPLETSAVETVEALGKFLPDVDRPNAGVFAWQEEAVPGGVVDVHYVGVEFDTGEQFDASWDRGQSARFPLPQLIGAWQQGIPGMKVGGKRTLIIPSALAYGKRGAGGGEIPPDADLIFDVELLNVK